MGAPHYIHSMDPVEIGAWLRSLRKAAGLRQPDLASILDMSQAWVSRAETGDMPGLSVVDLLRWGEACGQPISLHAGLERQPLPLEVHDALAGLSPEQQLQFAELARSLSAVPPAIWSAWLAFAQAAQDTTPRK